MLARSFQLRCVLFFVLLSVVSATNAYGQLQYSVTDLGTFLVGGTSVANAVNNLGQVVGNADSGGYAHAFLFSGGSMQDLGTLGGVASSAASINNAGQIVGEALTSSGAAQAFLYSGSGPMQSLGTLPGAGTSFATGINASGQVVGYSGTGRLSLQRRLHAEPWHALGAIQRYECGQRHQQQRGRSWEGLITTQAPSAAVHKPSCSAAVPCKTSGCFRANPLVSPRPSITSGRLSGTVIPAALPPTPSCSVAVPCRTWPRGKPMPSTTSARSWERP